MIRLNMCHFSCNIGTRWCALTLHTVCFVWIICGPCTASFSNPQFLLSFCMCLKFFGPATAEVLIPCSFLVCLPLATSWPFVHLVCFKPQMCCLSIAAGQTSLSPDSALAISISPAVVSSHRISSLPRMRVDEILWVIFARNHRC